MEFIALNTLCCIPYNVTDCNTGICRMNRDLFDQLEIKMGFVVHLNLAFGDGSCCTVLCTAWPDSSDNLPCNTICVDGSVRLKNGSYLENWVECKCTVGSVCKSVSVSVTQLMFVSVAKVLRTLPQQPCSSIVVDQMQPATLRSSPEMHISWFLGLAVTAGCEVYRDGKVLTSIM